MSSLLKVVWFKSENFNRCLPKLADYMCTLVAAMVVSYNEVTKYGGAALHFQ